MIPGAVERTPWQSAPADLREGVETLLGAPVVAAATQSGGFSRGVASRLRCADGRRFFVKAVDSAADPYALSLYEREARIAPLLPPHLPAPRFLAPVRRADWLALVFHEAPGRMVTPPWTDRQIRRVVSCLTTLTGLGTPCPIADAPGWGGPAREWRGWGHMLRSAGLPAGLPDTIRQRADTLAALEAGFTEAASGDTLLHSDLRADNIMMADDGTVVLVDWAQAARGAAWLDPLIFALGAALDGVPAPERLFLRHPAAHRAPPGAIDRVLAALAGRFTYLATTPGPAAVRALQRREARICLDWLTQRHAL